MPTTGANKAKRGSMGRLFGRKKDKDKEEEPQHGKPHHASDNSNLGPPTFTSDSAYASSENEPKASMTKSSDTVPMENTGQISGVSGDRNLAMNKNTGDVIDEDTGKVVTTTTTTTTV